MARRLGISAEQDPRCLACHVNPHFDLKGAGNLWREEQSFGVGCEACHGAAEKWLDRHTGEEWKELKREQKRRYGMLLVRDREHNPPLGLVERVGVCAGCHVGAPADGKTGLAREVTHEFIAAGHPRLSFEFVAFMLNMPAHWRPADDPTFSSRAWGIGQVGTAEAALRTLSMRAEDKTHAWAELSEYDCFACHHDLADPSWRREPRAGRSPAALGTAEWGSWYFPLLERATGQTRDTRTEDLRASVDDIRKAMTLANPDRRRAAAAAQRTAELLAPLGEELERDAAHDAATISRLMRATARQERERALASWDRATQLYLALAAWDESLPRGSSRPTHDLIQRMQTLLKFPPGVDSPANFRRTAEFDKQFEDLLSQIGK
jgi:hypothetical protein